MRVKQITVISGKGGTGKTTLTASFAALAAKKVLADCDVDAADLHLILNPQILQRTPFYGGKVARIDPERCSRCGLCEQACRFDAIHGYQVDEVACEGCGLCYHLCPEKAVELRTRVAGEWYLSESRYGPVCHARLRAGEENSGKLVALVRNQAKRLAEQKELDYVLIDGPPGVGCPVISSITGVDLVVVVTEPTVSGIHDLQRVLQVASQFQVPALVVINKSDINPENSAQIEAFCRRNGVPVAGKIPFDPVVVEALLRRRPVVEFVREGVGEIHRRIWRKVEAYASQLATGEPQAPGAAHGTGRP